MTNNNLQKKILNEIEKTGFPLELRVSKYLSENNYLVANNIYYIDLDEGKGREIDIRALKNCTIEDEGITYYCRNWYFIECKKSKNKPWIIFTSPQTPYDVDLFRLGCKGTMNEPTEAWHIPKIMATLHKDHPFINAKNCGRSYIEAFKNFESGKAILSSIVSSVKATTMAKIRDVQVKSSDIAHYYPVVVFEGDLFEAYLDNNEMCVKESELIYVSFFYQSLNYEESKYIVPVVRERSLPLLMKSLNDVLNFIGKEAKSNLSWFRREN